MITGDHHLVARHVARAVGLDGATLLTGSQLDELHDEALWSTAERTAIFAEVDPNQKERIILALKKTGHVVGFMGDGINDAPAMHAADTSISVESAVDVARDAADFVLLEQDLDVVRRGITLGRNTFANTLKYIQTTLSANLGNMISMAAASLFLPFLPLLASQILLNNFLSDIPAFGLAGDSVDPELVTRPRRWNVRELRRFMIKFGLLSSVFDFATFGVLLLVYRAAAVEFRTAWFVESLLTELVVALVVRTRRPFFRSRPGRFLLWSTVATCRRGVRAALLAARAVARVHAAPAGARGPHRRNHGGLCGRRRVSEARVLPQRRADASAAAGGPAILARADPEIGLSAGEDAGTFRDGPSDHEEPGRSAARIARATEALRPPGRHAKTTPQAAPAHVRAGRGDVGGGRHRHRGGGRGTGCDSPRSDATGLRNGARHVGTRGGPAAYARTSHRNAEGSGRIEPPRTGDRRRRRRRRARREGTGHRAPRRRRAESRGRQRRIAARVGAAARPARREGFLRHPPIRARRRSAFPS